jgi:polysaccharide deacetylase family protein (PEP-CTERM system associated)
MLINTLREQAGLRDSQPKASTPIKLVAQPAAKTANAFTVDVEDYFQVEAFKPFVPGTDWDKLPSRVERNTGFLLDMLAEANVSATFFVLGWIAERHPGIIRRIQAEGHEVASHGYSHQVAYLQTPDVFRDDIRRAKHILEDVTGQHVIGYRAPTFSIRRENWWAYDILAEEGYIYSSSLYPISHDLYGIPNAPTVPFRPIRNGLLEIPLSTVRMFNRNLPCSGGGYFRLLPYAVSKWCIERVIERGNAPYVFYCHPWEFDAEQPRMSANFKSRFRHYTNIGLMPRRVTQMLREFSWSRMDKVFARELDRTGEL